MTAATSPALAPRIAFLGLGWIGQKRLEALVGSGAARAVALADPCADGLDKARGIARDARVAGSFAELLSEPMDGLVIATPSGLHAAQAIAALERGVPVFCQKPLACSAAEARRVVDAARHADRLLGLDLSYRHLAAADAVRHLIASGALGHVFAIEATFHNAYGPSSTWCRDRRRAGGGCVIDLGVHLVDLALWMLDFPEVIDVSAQLFCGGRRFDRDTDEVEDYASGDLRLAGDTAVSVTCSWFLPIGEDARIRIACYGTRGGAVIENVNGSFTDFAAWRLHGRAREALAVPPDDWGGRAAIAWARRLAASRRFDEHAERYVTVAAVLDRIYAS
jgi:predicted dehydrogenase